MTNKKPKNKLCTECPVHFKPANSMQKVCSAGCAYKRVTRLNKRKADASINKQIKVEKQAIKVRKQALKRTSEWKAELQVIFNKFIRIRDKDLPCISCGNFVSDIDLITGSRWDCGHYLSRGAFPELRFTELNCHKQCSSCNGGSNKYTKKNHTVTQQYTDNLINKIGIVQFEWLKRKHPPLKLSVNDIKELKVKYRLKIKELL